ncbi:putative ribonuclease H-like domain-containing protein [Tanacetum coccineum]|uniref:Ribonuclease H-like domain-containing protein n=1 Tax=Tanacetum coccineum TaxID=301880 RepID=A0ABQ5CL53_9ASTR
MSAKDKNGLGYGTQLDEISNKSETDSEISMIVFEVRSSDEEITPANDRFSKADGYHAVPPPITGNFLTLRADISFAGLDEYAIRKKIIESKTTEPQDNTSESKTSETVGKTNEVEKSKPKINKDKVIIEDWNSDDEDDVSEVNTFNPVKTNETQTVKTQVDKIGQISQKEGIGFKKIKACFVCKSTDHLIKDCDFYAKKSPVCDNAKRVNHQKISQKLKYPQTRRTFVPKRVLTKTGLINHVKPNGKRAIHNVSNARPISTARPVSTDRQFAPKIAQTGSAIRPIYPRMDNVRPRASYSPIKRSYYTRPVVRPKDLKQDVKTSGVKNMTTAGTRAVVNTSKGKMDNALKKSRWVWRPKGNYMDHESKEKGSFILKKFEYVDPKGISKSVDHALVDSGCSSHMTGNKAYLSDYEDYNGGFVAFGSDPKGGKITGKGKIRTANLDFDDVYFVDELKFNLFSVSQMYDKKNSVLFTDTECLILPHSFKLLDENQVVLRAPKQNGVYSLDLKNIVPSGDILGKFDGKSNEGYLLGYSTTSKAFRVYNKRTKRVEENMHIDFLEDQNVAGKWTRLELVLPLVYNTVESSFVYHGRTTKIVRIQGNTIDYPSTLFNVDLPIDPNMPDLEDIFNAFPNDGIFSRVYDDKDVGTEADFNNMDNTIDVSPILTLRVHKDHPKGQILGDPKLAVQTRGKIQKASSVQQALDKSWVEAMQEELLQFKLQKVWILVDLPFRKKAIGTKWVFRNKRDARSIVVKNKARLVAQEFRQEEGIDYDEVFAHVSRIEAIGLFLAFASCMGFPVYQIDVKSAFFMALLERRSHQDSKSLGMNTILLQSLLGKWILREYHRSKPWFIRKRTRVKQQPDGIFISQDKYVADILKEV